jgi:dephospho-CoA kinase
MPRKKTTELVGLTGGIATGKSTVSGMLRKSGIPVLCADEIAHAVTAKGTPVARKIVKAFGKTVLAPSGELDRGKIARLVFHDAKKRAGLENIVHPAVRKELQRLMRQERVKKTPLVVLDVPLLFEAGFDTFCDATVCVIASRATQLERLRLRGLGRRDALARIKAQMPLKEKAKRADSVLKNDGTKAELRTQVRGLLAELRRASPFSSRERLIA